MNMYGFSNRFVDTPEYTVLKDVVYFMAAILFHAGTLC